MDAGLKKQIDGFLEEAEKGSLLQSMEKIYSTLRENGLMWSSTVHSRWIGVHESNRDGTGISPDHVQKLCLDFFEFGYVPSASRRICIELDAGSNCSEDTRAYNEKLIQQSNNRFLRIGQCIATLQCGYFSLVESYMCMSWQHFYIDIYTRLMHAWQGWHL